VLSYYRVESPPPADKDAGKKPPPEPPKLPPLTVDVVALAHALGQSEALPKVPADQKDIAAVGAVVGSAFRSGEKAREEARKLRTASQKAQALVAIADVLKDDEAKAAAEEAARLVAGELGDQVISPWALVRLARLGVALGLADNEVQVVANRIRGDEQLRGWAQLQLFRKHLAAARGRVEEALADEVDRESLSHRLARLELARHNTARDKGAAKAVDGWDDSLKPYGYMGVALGLQGTE
jgi:hypothetical protein